jgi:hypothetical protein
MAQGNPQALLPSGMILPGSGGMNPPVNAGPAPPNYLPQHVQALMRYRQLAQQAGGMPSAPTMATAAGPGMVGNPQPAQPMVSIAGQPFNQAGQPMQQNGFQKMMPGTPLQAAPPPPTNQQANAAQYAALARQFGPAAAASAFPGMAPNPQAAPVMQTPMWQGAQPMSMAGVGGPVNALARYYTR